MTYIWETPVQWNQNTFKKKKKNHKKIFFKKKWEVREGGKEVEFTELEKVKVRLLNS